MCEHIVWPVCKCASFTLAMWLIGVYTNVYHSSEQVRILFEKIKHTFSFRNGQSIKQMATRGGVLGPAAPAGPERPSTGPGNAPQDRLPPDSTSRTLLVFRAVTASLQFTIATYVLINAS